MLLLGKVAHKSDPKVRSPWNTAYLFLWRRQSIWQNHTDKVFEIPNCFGSYISNVEIPSHKNNIRIMIENY